MDRIELVPHHCGMSVADLDAAAEWLDRVLGFELVRKDDFLAPQGIHVAFVKNGDFIIELFQHVDHRPVPPERMMPDDDARTLGTKHMCFQVSDMDAMVQHLRENEVDVVLGPLEVPGAVVCFIHSPDKILIELLQVGPRTR